MKSKKRHQSSSEESEESEASLKSNSSSGSESDNSSASEHRYRKKRKRAESSKSDSESDDQKRNKKRKHKKKKKKHSKKRRRSNSAEESDSGEVSSVSEGEISLKKKRKHKHKHKHTKRARTASASENEELFERRLHSVVKERRDSSEDDSQPSRTYYQKEYHRSASGEDYEREREMQRFYRGSSKERKHQYQQNYQFDRERNNRYERYEGRRSPDEEYRRRPREENYHSREDARGYNRYNQYEEKASKRREYDDGRDYRERHGPPESERYREREYPDKKERYREDRFSIERLRDARREKPGRTEKPTVSHQRDQSKSRSPEDRYRDKNRKPQNREEREDRYRDGRGDEWRERPGRSEEHKEDRSRPTVRTENKPRERKSRFTDANENKEYAWGKVEVKKEGGKTPGEKEKPNFGLSGKLTADANTVNGVVIKYTEPDDAKQPKRRWRFYPFKGDKALPILYIHRQSCFLIGRDKKVVDIALEHPSISKQHAALQYRATPFNRADGTQGRRVRPYIIDLESANGTFVNNKKIEPRRYVELLERDVVKFGFSQREYVLLHENSKDDEQDDDHQEPTGIGSTVTTTDQIKQDKRVKQEIAEDGD